VSRAGEIPSAITYVAIEDSRLNRRPRTSRRPARRRRESQLVLCLQPISYVMSVPAAALLVELVGAPGDVDVADDSSGPPSVGLYTHHDARIGSVWQPRAALSTCSVLLLLFIAMPGCVAVGHADKWLRGLSRDEISIRHRVFRHVSVCPLRFVWDEQGSRVLPTCARSLTRTWPGRVRCSGNAVSNRNDLALEVSFRVDETTLSSRGSSLAPERWRSRARSLRA